MNPIEQIIGIARRRWFGGEESAATMEVLAGLPRLLRDIQLEAGGPVEFVPFDPLLDLRGAALPNYPMCTPVYPDRAGDYTVLEGVVREERWVALWAASFWQVQAPAARVSVVWADAFGSRVAGGSTWLTVPTNAMGRSAQVSFVDPGTGTIVVGPDRLLSIVSAEYDAAPAPAVDPQPTGPLPVLLHGFTAHRR